MEPNESAKKLIGSGLRSRADPVSAWSLVRYVPCYVVERCHAERPLLFDRLKLFFFRDFCIRL